ncbi:MAG TPA: cation:proton antiporter [Mariprofundaceae bacterium]|nr:cation:proton antiporter [Mariprofundaceae bacterium]
MDMDPLLPSIVGAILAILAMTAVLRRFEIPHVVGYLLAGVILGPHLLGLISNHGVLERLGTFGVVLLLFFLGMEISPKRLLANWRIAVAGTLLQIVVSVTVIWLMGVVLGWPVHRSILFGFAISLSSTAVVLKLLQARDETETRSGQAAVAILLAQDMAVVPMLMIIGAMGGDHISVEKLAAQAFGSVLVLALFAWIVIKESVHLPFLRKLLSHDHEHQVFTALILCFGFALITGLLSLSSALGAFMAGMLIKAAKETEWVYRSLEPFYVVFVALFFVSIGMMLDLDFFRAHFVLIIALVLAAFVTNTFINAFVFRMLGDSWPDSIYTAALLAQIGEFSFVLVALGAASQIISTEGYQLAIAVIALSLMLAPFWIFGIRHWMKRSMIV